MTPAACALGRRGWGGRRTGPGSGACSIRRGLPAGSIAIVLGVGIMLGYYRFSGMLAVAGLALYVLYTLAVLAGFDAELCDTLAEDYRQSGVHLHFGHRLAALQRDGDGVRLRPHHGRATSAFDTVLFGHGTPPAPDGLCL